MRKILLILLTVSFLASCKIFYGDNYDNRIKKLELGMKRSEVINLMGENYIVENMSRTPEGNIEALKFNTDNYSNYVLVFLDGELVEINNIPRRPVPPQQNVTISHDNSK